MDLIKKFTDQLERCYQELPKQPKEKEETPKFMVELFEEFFHIFPSRLIDEEKQPLFISKDYFKLPPEVERKLKEIIQDEEEYERIKCEIQRAPKELSPSEFLTLYEELREEMEQKGTN